MKKLLKPRGQVVMIDFHKRDLPVGPPVAEKIARNDLIAQLQQNGFRLVEEHTLLPYQYFLVFVAKQAFVSVPGSGLRVVEPPTELTRNAEPGTRNH